MYMHYCEQAQRREMCAHGGGGGGGGGGGYRHCEITLMRIHYGMATTVR